jgi:2-C-methyl-D-erythritol 4-phosphate cytidylyltransferase
LGGSLYFAAMRTCAIIVAAGSSERFGGAVPKQFRMLLGKPLLAWAISRFEEAESIDDIEVVVAEEYLLYASEKIVNPYGFRKVSRIVPGGATRQESVLKGLERLPISTGLVAIHDGARPLTSPADIDRVVTLASREHAAILAAPVTDTVKRVEQGYVMTTLDRQVLYHAQTPQVFQYDLIIEAHRQQAGKADVFTDDASLIESRGFKVRAVEPTSVNLKVTTPHDMVLAEAILRQEGHS